MKKLYFVTGVENIKCFTFDAKETDKQYKIEGSVQFRNTFKKSDEGKITDGAFRGSYMMFSSNKESVEFMIPIVRDRILSDQDNIIKKAKAIRSSICSPVEYKDK